jgi:hypothetical protein
MILRIFSILFLSALIAALAFGQGSDIPQEYQVKAKYLLNIPMFIEIQPQVRIGATYTIGLIGDTPLESILAASKGKIIKNRPLMIRRVFEPAQMEGCQMLFISSSERHRLQALLPEAHRRGILTVSDMRDFARLGGIFSLLTIDNRIVFDLNLSSADKASLAFSSHLLKLAHDIIN